MFSKKLKTAMAVYHSAKELKLTALRTQHPEWNQDRVRQEILDILADAIEKAFEREPSYRRFN